jgi:hypothetical protein
MEKYTHRIPVLIVIMSLVMSCNKDQTSPGGNNAINSPVRKVRYELFTKENFAGNTENIQFIIFMRIAQKTIFDSPLAVMKLKDIPDSGHRIIIEKLVPDNDTSTMAVGFEYQIENIGMSRYLDSFSSFDSFKLVQYPFR